MGIRSKHPRIIQKPSEVRRFTYAFRGSKYVLFRCLDVYKMGHYRLQVGFVHSTHRGCSQPQLPIYVRPFYRGYPCPSTYNHQLGSIACPGASRSNKSPCCLRGAAKQPQKSHGFALVSMKVALVSVKVGLVSVKVGLVSVKLGLVSVKVGKKSYKKYGITTPPPPAKFNSKFGPEK